MINSYVSLPDGTNSSILASCSCEHMSGRGSALRPGRPSPGRHAGAAKTQGKVSDKRFGLHHHQNTMVQSPTVPGTIGTISLECVCPWYCFCWRGARCFPWNYQSWRSCLEVFLCRSLYFPFLLVNISDWYGWLWVETIKHNRALFCCLPSGNVT